MVWCHRAHAHAAEHGEDRFAVLTAGRVTETPSGTRLAAGSEQASGGGYRGGTLPPAGFGKASADDGQVGDDDSG